jgi:uncharacterized protein YndB with AHSA1/START domain
MSPKLVEPMSSRSAALLLAVTLLLPAGRARADVVGSAEGWFTTRAVATMQAPRDRVWKAIVDDVDRWWSPDHTWSHDPRNLSIDPRPGGCFCEKLPRGGVRHMEVVYVDREKLLRLTGALGPMQEQALSGAMTWALESAGEGTRLAVTYRVAGHADLEGGLATLAPAVDRVLGEQVERLRLYVETGSPQPRSPKPSAEPGE